MNEGAEEAGGEPACGAEAGRCAWEGGACLAAMDPRARTSCGAGAGPGEVVAVVAVCCSACRARRARVRLWYTAAAANACSRLRAWWAASSHACRAARLITLQGGQAGQGQGQGHAQALSLEGFLTVA